MNIRRITSIALLCAATGCAGGGNTAAAGGSVADDSNAVADLGAETGQSAADTALDAALAAETIAEIAAPVPCGAAVGDVLCDPPLQGYFRNETKGLATSADYGDFNLQNVASSVSQKYIVVVNGAWW